MLGISVVFFVVCFLRALCDVTASHETLQSHGMNKGEKKIRGRGRRSSSCWGCGDGDEVGALMTYRSGRPEQYKGKHGMRTATMATAGAQPPAADQHHHYQHHHHDGGAPWITLLSLLCVQYLPLPLPLSSYPQSSARPSAVSSVLRTRGSEQQ